MGVRRIARELRLSRNTVRRYLRDPAAPESQPRPERPNAQLEPFQHGIETMLSQELIGSRILAELRKQGYHGPQRTFYRYLARLATLASPSPAVERFETEPARQGQYDWSEYTVLLGGAVTKVYIHSFVLGYSRFQHLLASLHVRQAAIFEALEDSFACVGGVPQEMLFDNPRALVTRPRPNLVFNPRLLEFARFYGFAPRACWPGRAQTKGKVERPFQMVEEQFIKGSAFLDWADLNRRLAQFAAETLNARIHGTTQERPQDRLLKEQLLLGKLPATRFISAQECFRKVSLDCLVSFGGSRYSVPWQYAGKHVWIRLERDLGLVVLAPTGEVLARHRLNPVPGSTNIDREHYQGLREQSGSSKSLLGRVFQQRFPEERAGRFLEKLLAQYKFNATFQLQRILALLASYPRAAILLAFEQALEYNTFSYRFLCGILSRQESAPDLPEPTLFGPERVLPRLNVTRVLDRYQTLLDEAPHD
jgi:transposase